MKTDTRNNFYLETEEQTLNGNFDDDIQLGMQGKPGKDGVDGKDYVLTPNDKQEIAEMAAKLVDVPGSGGNVDGAVLYTKQNPTEEQKAQARNNIGAVTLEEVLAALPVYNGEVEDV